MSQQVQAHAAYHKSLLDQRAALEDAPGALKTHKAYKEDLERQKKTAERKVTHLAFLTGKERAEHENIRDSVARRWTAKLVGRKEKFEEKQAKEEREYVEALENEMRVRNEIGTLKGLISEAERTRNELSGKAAEYERLDKELHSLYSKIFDGPTQEYPQDDLLENNLYVAQSDYDQLSSDLDKEKRAEGLLSQTREKLKQCQIYLGQASSASTWDMWGGGTLADAMERSALSKAQAHAMSAQTILYQAGSASHSVNTSIIDELYIAQGSLMSDVIFDNIFTDYAFHQKIQQSRRSCEEILGKMEREQAACKDRVSGLKERVEESRLNLMQRKAELDRFRMGVFEIFGGGGTTSQSEGPPPEYSKTN